MPGRTKEETAVVSSTERAVLGLLTSGEQSGYDLLKEAERSVGFFWTPAKTLLPVLLLYGGADRNQPTGTSIAILQQLTGARDFTYRLFPDAPHPLIDERGFATGLFPAVVDWLRGHGLAA